MYQHFKSYIVPPLVAVPITSNYYNRIMGFAVYMAKFIWPGQESGNNVGVVYTLVDLPLHGGHCNPNLQKLRLKM